MDVKNVLGSIDKDFIRKGSAAVNSEDVKKVLDKANEITEKVVKSGPLQRFLKDVALLISMVKDYWSGKYREVSWWVIAAVVFALLYVLSPIDLIPDFIPVIGLLDDAVDNRPMSGDDRAGSSEIPGMERGTIQSRGGARRG